MSSYDVIIVGSGPGGYVAAIRAAQLGLKTAVVEREHLGGICLNWGCIPTKALLRSAEILKNTKEAKGFGIIVDGAVTADAAGVVQRSRAVSKQLNNGVEFLLRKNKIDVIWGEATLTAPGRVRVAPTAKKPMQPQPAQPRSVLPPGDYEAKHIVLATGARPRVLPGLEPDGARIWTYFEAMVPKAFPKSLIVVGSGAIGVEFASFYRAMGTDVTIVEVLPQILAVEDAEVAAFARKQFEKQGIKILTAAKIASLDKAGDRLVAKVESGGSVQTIEAERLISAVGVVANVEGLGLEALGVKIERGTIVTDGFGRTNVPQLYAIGDVAGPPMLAHKAEHEGILCVEAIKGLHPHAMERGMIPGCTYCNPQIASVGLTEAKAKEQGLAVKVGRFPFIGNGKAIALGESEGFVKTIFDAKSGKLLGAHLAGPEVTELVQGFVVAMNCETTEQELIETIFPHPTLSEAMHESVFDAYGRVIHT